MLRNRNEYGKTKLMRISRQPSTGHILIDQKQLDNVEIFNLYAEPGNKWCKMYTCNSFHDFHGRSSILKNEEWFISRFFLKFKEQTSKVLHFGHSFVWCWNLDTVVTRSEIPQTFWNFMLEKDGDQVDQLCEKWNIIWSPGGKEHPTCRKMKEG